MWMLSIALSCFVISSKSFSQLQSSRSLTTSVALQLQKQPGSRDKATISNSLASCDITGPISICAGGSAQYVVTTDAAPPSTFAWSLTDNTSGAVIVGSNTGASVNVDPGNATGSYRVVVIITDNVGVVSSCDRLVTVNSVPSVTALNTLPVCVGSTLDLSASNVPGATYSWTGPNGFVSSQQNPSITNATTLATGVYSVTATLNG
ncbi:MAG TPA: immunoglobulin domain-containing protein, partial [Flavitalea sp.]|nr:immunoglobulin domain-containing protein [Flavitalea sp.]